MEFFEKFLSHTENSRALEAALYTLRNAGKRIRPNLVFKTAALFDVYDENVERIACAVELIHNYSLIHDDLPCMDDDDFRRGKPSCHKVFGACRRRAAQSCRRSALRRTLRRKIFQSHGQTVFPYGF